MGRMESKSTIGVKYYDVLSKKTFGDIAALDRRLPLYSFENQGGSRLRETYFDTPGKLLTRAGLTLCKVVEGNKACFIVEKQFSSSSRLTLTHREEKIFVQDIEPNDDVKKHMTSIIDGITSMFTTNFSVDLENVLKTVQPKLDILTRYSQLKVFSGNGFKGLINFEEVQFKNYETRKNAERLMMKVQMTSSVAYLSTFDDFNKELQRLCKTIFEINDTKFQIAQRVTNPQTNTNNGKK